MEPIRVQKNGLINKRDLDHLGGAYTVPEKILMGGVGSSKIIYRSGLSHFDEFHRSSASELGFVSFELLKNGLILRLNINQRFACLGAALDNLPLFHLTAYRIKITERRWGRRVSKIVYRGKLALVNKNETAHFDVTVGEFESIIKFFRRSEFVTLFSHSVSLNPPENDIGSLISTFDL